VALSAIKLVLVGLIVVLLISLVWSAYFQPLGTLAFLAFGLFASVLTEHPLAVIFLLAVAFITRSRSNPIDKKVPLLAPPKGN
jgi:uncharacterized membrane protein